MPTGLELELCTGANGPKTAVLRKTADLRIKNYLGNKRPLLTNLIQEWEGHQNPGKEERAHIFLSKAAFTALGDLLKNIPGLTGLKIFFASYKVTGNPNLDLHIPAGEENLMTLIFHPTTKTATVPDNTIYYIQSHLNLLAPIVQIPIQDINAFPWVEHYALKAAVLETADDQNPKKETKSIWFEGLSFLDWQNEIDCMEQNGQPVQGLRMTFAAYDPAEEVVVNKMHFSVGDQLTMIIKTFPPCKFSVVPTSNVATTAAMASMASTASASAPASTSGTAFFHHIRRKKKGLVDTAAFPEDFDTSIPCPPASCDN